MPTPMYRFRLATETREALEEMSDIYGAPNPSAFIREIVTLICANDGVKLGAFFARLQERIEERLKGQLSLPLQEQAAQEMKSATDAVAEAGRRLPAAKRPAKRGKEAKRVRKPS